MKSHGNKLFKNIVDFYLDYKSEKPCGIQWMGLNGNW